MKRALFTNNQRIKFILGLILVCSTTGLIAQGSWGVVPTPDLSTTRNMLRDISGTSSTDVWTVGSYETATAGNMKNLIMHWDGSAWQLYSNTDLSTTHNDLWGVAAISSVDVWAVGSQNTPGNTNSQLLHWNGSNWTHMVLPVNSGGSYLDGIDAIAADDIWAVGGQAGSPVRPVYTIHYDGSNWTEVTAPNVGTFRNAFYAVDGIASNDVWAVGHYGNSYGDFHSMAQHWNGSNWSISALPPAITSLLGELYTVTMIASDDVWAMGSTLTGDLIMIHWNGSMWSTMPTSGSAGGAITGGEEIYGVGYRISQWNGSNWSIIDSINQVEYPTLVSAITFSNGDVWAAGTWGAENLYSLVYRSLPEQGPLAVDMHAYAVTKSGNVARMSWSTSAESNADHFVMERSRDGIHFISVTEIPAKGVASNYQLVDSSPLPGNNYYRLKLIDIDGSSMVYPIHHLFFDDKDLKSFSVFPTFIQQGSITINLYQEEVLDLSLFNHIGQPLASWTLSPLDATTILQLPFDLASGVYILSTTVEGKVWSERIVIE